MNKWFIKFLLSCIVLLSGYGKVHAQFNQYAVKQEPSSILIKVDSHKQQSSDKMNSSDLKKLKRKICILENEENEEESGSVAKQIIKSNYFLNFFSDDKIAISASIYNTKKLNYYKKFILLSNKVYLLFEVFRI